MFRDNDLGFALQFGIVLLVDLFAEDEHHEIGVLLGRTRFAQVGELRTMIAATAFRSTTQLRKRNYRNAKFFGKGLQPTRNSRDFLRTVFEALAAARHEL